MGFMVMSLRGAQSAPDQVELPLWGRDAAFRLLLEGVQDIDGGLEPDRVNGPEGIAVVARDDLHYTRAEALQRLRVPMLSSELGAVDREPHVVLHGVKEALQIRLAGADPFDRFDHAAAISAL